jgi:hypothetical protein
MEFAFGFLKLTPDEYWEMNRREFSAAIKGYWRHEEIRELRENERARIVAYTVYCGQYKGKNGINKSIEQFWPLHKQTEEEKEELRRKRKELKNIFPERINVGSKS